MNDNLPQYPIITLVMQQHEAYTKRYKRLPTKVRMSPDILTRAGLDPKLIGYIDGVPVTFNGLVIHRVLGYAVLEVA